MLPLFDENPTRRFPVTTVLLICINLTIFIYMLILKSSPRELFIYRFSVVPWEIMHGQQLPPNGLYQLLGGYYPSMEISKNVYLSLLTSMFLHSGWLHIIFNMLFLWVFGNNVEDVMGSLPFTGFYLICGLAGTMAEVLIYPKSITPMLGASGAIAGVLGAYLLLYPRARVYTLVFILIIPLPAFLVIGIWIITQFFYGVMSLSEMTGNVAWFAHLGGVSCGLVITFLFYPILRRRRDRFAYERLREQMENAWNQQA